MFKFLKKKEEAPPDVGKEASDVITEVSPDDVPVDDSPSEEESRPLVSNISSARAGSGSVVDSLELQKIQARLESFNEIMKGFNERFSVLNQQIGEIRAMSIANEKNISRSELESQKAVDIVKEVEPEKLRLDYQRIDMKANSLSEKIEGNKQFMESIMEEVKELKRKAGVFEGTDAILKLGSDVKKDLVELQKMAGRVRMNTDKSEEIFIQLKSGLSESEKLKQMIDNLDNLYAGMRKEMDKINMEHSDSMKKKEFDDFKFSIENKFKAVENAFFEAQKIKQDNENIAEALEKLALGLQRNEEDIANIGITIGNDKVKRISDYENKLYSILEVLDKMAFEIGRLKEKVGIKTNSTLDNNPEQVFIPVANITPMQTVNSKPAIVVENSTANIDINEINNSLETNNTESDNSLQKKPEETQKSDELKTRDISNLDIEKKVIDIKPKQEIFKERIDSERRINDLLLSGGYYLVRRDPANAVRIYRELAKIYNTVFDKNKNTYYKIMRFYENILRLSDVSEFDKEPVKEPEKVVLFGGTAKTK